MKLKAWIYSKYLYIVIFTFILSLSFFLDFKKKILTSSSKKNTLTGLTLVRLIDSKFENFIPYIEPGAMDHYSYTPSRIKYIRLKVKELYGYDILDKEIYRKKDECTLNYKPTGIINYCVAKNYWLNLSNEEWTNLLDKYDIEIVIAPFKIENLYLCNSYIVQKRDVIIDHIDVNHKDKIFYYKKSKDSICQKLIPRNVS